MGFFSRRAESSVNKRIHRDPRSQQIISAINSYGSYDGSADSRIDAERVFNGYSNIAGCSNAHTKSLYWETLEATSLPLPLAIAYSFAIGEYLEMPYYDPVASGGNTPQAQQNAMAIGAMFPDYKEYVESKHSVTETRYILALSSNIVQEYL